MFPRRTIRLASASPIRSVSTSASAKWARACVVHSSPQCDEEQTEHSVSSHSALQRRQLEFCCLLCGWDVACKTCPFNWFNFDPRKFRTKQRRRRGPDDDPAKFAASEADVRRAMETLGVGAAPTNGFDHVSLTQQQVKDAFRAKALEWHPDCNQTPDAERIFKEVLEAYELLLAHAR
ncbi:hypothetical protein PHYPSEUDO_005148 [Phytophthora pseudosyringae]|uniref:J domain-containing protein n=1 Tax=Phytophthora pseudosyringae TaxID=221518 RepID=A0A8T1VQ73_9STRA|nr:hypothetical protein PHYPSEUDO_005148 [Phytophthora pseudosyringae]